MRRVAPAKQKRRFCRLRRQAAFSVAPAGELQYRRPMPRLKLTLAYEGTRYCGWQLQAAPAAVPSSWAEKAAPSPASPPCVPASVARGCHNLPTIQGTLEHALAGILGFRAPLTAAGRTDAGVHAEAQICHCDVPEEKAGVDWLRALNTKLPQDIRVLEAVPVAPDFHARKDARSKVYAYSLWMSRQKALPRVQAFVWSTPVLATERMREAGRLLLGRHNFASFQNVGTPIRETTRTLYDVRYETGTIGGRLRCPEDWPVCTLYFEGDGFLKQMVRNIVGMIVWVGLGKIEARSIPDILAASDRRALPGPSAPARGLTLMEVKY